MDWKGSLQSEAAPTDYIDLNSQHTSGQVAAWF